MSSGGFLVSTGGLPHELRSCRQDADVTVPAWRGPDVGQMCTAVEPLLSAGCVFIAAESLVPDGQLRPVCPSLDPAEPLHQDPPLCVET